MTDLKFEIARELQKHQYRPVIMECSCTDEVDYPPSLDWDDYSDHLATVAMEVVNKNTATEWGVDYRDGSVDFFDDRDSAEDYLPVMMIGVGFTKEDLPLLVKRQVLPWQEVWE